MTYENKKVILDVMFRELEAEILYEKRSEEVTKLAVALKDYITSYTKGIDRFSHLMSLSTLLELNKGEE